MTPKDREGGTITILIDPEKKKEFQDLCDSEGRPMNRVIVRLIEAYIDGEFAPKKWNR